MTIAALHSAVEAVKLSKKAPSDSSTETTTEEPILPNASSKATAARGKATEQRAKATEDRDEATEAAGKATEAFGKATEAQRDGGTPLKKQVYFV
ncbi:hypothetical protein PybrP1_006944 [[Pythium] brassicae (nom. inval.)]|nr:hypothetical protein PybrP1_006944 [[Pythium] brassicae (nom. inval.)]